MSIGTTNIKGVEKETNLDNIKEALTATDIPVVESAELNQNEDDKIELEKENEENMSSEGDEFKPIITHITFEELKRNNDIRLYGNFFTKAVTEIESNIDKLYNDYSLIRRLKETGLKLSRKFRSAYAEKIDTINKNSDAVLDEILNYRQNNATKAALDNKEKNEAELSELEDSMKNQDRDTDEKMDELQKRLSEDIQNQTNLATYEKERNFFARMALNITKSKQKRNRVDKDIRTVLSLYVLIRTLCKDEKFYDLFSKDEIFTKEFDLESIGTILECIGFCTKINGVKDIFKAYRDKIDSVNLFWDTTVGKLDSIEPVKEALLAEIDKKDLDEEKKEIAVTHVNNIISNYYKMEEDKEKALSSQFADEVSIYNDFCIQTKESILIALNDFPETKLKFIDEPFKKNIVTNNEDEKRAADEFLSKIKTHLDTEVSQILSYGFIKNIENMNKQVLASQESINTYSFFNDKLGFTKWYTDEFKSKLSENQLKWLSTLIAAALIPTDDAKTLSFWVGIIK